MTNYTKEDFILKKDSIIGLTESGYEKLSLTKSLEIPSISGVDTLGENLIDEDSKNDILNLYINEGIKRIENNAFSGCSIKKVHFPKSLNEIGEGAFYSCELLKLYIPKNVYFISEGVFQNNPLEIVDLSDSKITAISRCLFNNCKNLEVIKFPNSLKSIKEDSFANTWSLKEFTLPKKVNEICPWAFEASGIEKINIPNGSELVYIGDNAFLNARLKDFDFSKLENLEDIDDLAFAGTKLQKIIISGEMNVSEGAFRSIEGGTLILNTGLPEESVFEDSSFQYVEIYSEKLPKNTFKNCKIKEIKFRKLEAVSKSAFEGVLGLDLDMPDSAYFMD